jgi:catechol 2,3-dioxygenase-like lactoylglutathione lyase family enzyme
MTEKPKFGFIVEYVQDIQVAKRFYVGVLGLEVEREHPTFIQFETFAIATDEPMGGETKQEIWLVNDANDAFNTLSKQADICLPLKQFPFGTVFGVKDPDGHPRYILELSKHRPSQAAEYAAGI